MKPSGGGGKSLGQRMGRRLFRQVGVGCRKRLIWHRGGWGGEVLAVGFLAPSRSSAARAAHREQARSYIRFVPVIPEALARAPFRARLNIASYKQGGRVRWYRYYWHETNVGASLLATRRAGGARSRRRYKTHAMRLVPTRGPSPPSTLRTPHTPDPPQAAPAASESTPAPLAPVPLQAWARSPGCRCSC